MSSCSVCNDHRLVGGFSPSWCPVCSGHAIAVNPEKLAEALTELADARALVEQLNRELELEARCVEARDRSIAELKSKLAEVERDLRNANEHAASMVVAYNRELSRAQVAEYDCDSALSDLAQVKAERDELMDTNGTLLKNASMATNELAQVKARLEVVEGERERMRRAAIDAFTALMASNDADDWTIAAGLDINGDFPLKEIDHALSTSQPAKETK